jgi:hypothetical protein
MKTISRRDILATLGGAAGACAASSYPNRGFTAGDRELVCGHDVPWVYAALLPDVTAERAYHDYDTGYCMYGVFTSIVASLGEKLGEPYRSFPFGMMKYGKGGAGDWGSLCGALNGGAAVVGLFARTAKEQERLIDALFSWYERASLPAHVPRNPVLKIDLPSSVPASVLCHVSVTKWARNAGYKVYGKEQIERCRRVTADVARKTVTLLNSAFSPTPASTPGLNDYVASCRACHAAGGDQSDMRGKMGCGTCHTFDGKEHP